jgi:hypothetical protein
MASTSAHRKNSTVVKRSIELARDPTSVSLESGQQCTGIKAHLPFGEVDHFRFRQQAAPRPNFGKMSEPPLVGGLIIRPLRGRR